MSKNLSSQCLTSADAFAFKPASNSTSASSTCGDKLDFCFRPKRRLAKLAGKDEQKFQCDTIKESSSSITTESIKVSTTCGISPKNNELSKPSSSSLSTMCGSENGLKGSQNLHGRSNQLIIEASEDAHMISEPFKGFVTNPERPKPLASRPAPQADSKPETSFFDQVMGHAKKLANLFEGVVLTDKMLSICKAQESVKFRCQNGHVFYKYVDSLKA